MYDSEYFKKVIGNNYNSKEIYNTPKNDNENNIFPVNVDNPKTRYETNGNISYNNSPYPEDYNISNYQNSNTYPKEYQETQNTNANYQETENTSTEYPEIYNIVEPMVEELLNKNQDMEFTNGVVDTMAMEIYNALEADTNQVSSPVNSNGAYMDGSVINANSRPRHRNNLLFDLIRILILNNINRPRPPRPHPDRPTPYPPRPRY